MTLEGEAKVGGGHAATVIGNAYALATALFELDRDPPRARVNGVLQEFLDDRRRPLDHLPGGDSIDDLRWQDAYGDHRYP